MNTDRDDDRTDDRTVVARDAPVVTTDERVALRDRPAVAAAPDVEQHTEVMIPRDQVRWGSILAGLVTAFTLFLLLSVLLLAIGVQGIRVGDPNLDEAAGAGAIVTAIIALLCFFVGGFVAARSAAAPGRLAGLMNGFLVWGLGLFVVLLLAGLGLGGLLGAAGDLFQQYRAAGSPEPDANAQDILRGIRGAALPAFLSLLLPAVAAALGGLLGARDEVDIERTYRRT